MLINFFSAVKDDKVKIVAVDLQQMAPLPGVTQIQGDITKVCIHLSIYLCIYSCIHLSINYILTIQSHDYIYD